VTGRYGLDRHSRNGHAPIADPTLEQADALIRLKLH
jgi:hypothetical protein